MWIKLCVLGFACLHLVEQVNGVSMFTLNPQKVMKYHEDGKSHKTHPMVVTLPDPETPAPRDAKNLVELAESLNLTILVKGLEESGLDNIIDHEGKFTLFAPTDDAFMHIPDWAKNIPLKELLRFHVARGLVFHEELKNEMLVRTLLSKRDIRFNVYQNGQVITANGRQIVSGNYTAHNGVLHIINSAMVSVYDREGSIINEITRCPRFKTLTKLITLAKLQDALHEKGPYTLFAPTDDVFEKLPADFVKHLTDDPKMLREVLLYHVAGGTWYSLGLEDGMSLKTLQGGKLDIQVSKNETACKTLDGYGCPKQRITINGKVSLSGADATVANGAVHGVDGLLIPPSMRLRMERLTSGSARIKPLKLTKAKAKTSWKPWRF